MDIINNILGSEDKDIVVSLSKDKTWLEYLAYFLELKYNNSYFEVNVLVVPKTAVGKKCYFVFDGVVKGWMEIYKLKETEDNDICIHCIPILTLVTYKTPMTEIDEYEFKYFLDNSNCQ